MRIELPITLRLLDAQLSVTAVKPVTRRRSTKPSGKRRAARPRDGGKPAALHLLKPVKPNSKRARFLRYCAEPRTVAETMAHFRITRPNVMAYCAALNRDHGIGYALESGTITLTVPT